MIKENELDIDLVTELLLNKKFTALRLYLSFKIEEIEDNLLGDSNISINERENQQDLLKLYNEIEDQVLDLIINEEQ